MNAIRHPCSWKRSPCRLLACACALTLLLSACAPTSESGNPAPTTSPAAASTPAAAAAGTAATEPEEKCTNEPRTDENDKRPRCGGMGITAPASRAFHVVGGSGDLVDQVVCNIDDKFVLNGRMFGVEFSGGVDGTYKFVRTPNIPGLSWNAGGRYHIDFPDGPDKPGTMTTAGGGTTTAGAQSRTTSGGEHFTLTQVPACKS
ncbi:MAG: hypothetical protein K8F33_07625 [Thermomonas sp.]|uniref:hypothetical protein n=1 Tax=Thermomonas sp. TaxID=1971895 RepID=UPI001D30EC17|nr:hypothetical protein [Thermomonas sp.]MBZ0087949.1 hypothetical protein [Thermomonas sp.]